MLSQTEAEEIRRAALASASRVCAISFLLVQKGIFTVEELEKAAVRCSAELDQLLVQEDDKRKCDALSS